MPAERASLYPPLAIRPNKQQLPGPSGRVGRGMRAQCYTAEDWQAMYPHIARLYLQQGRPLREVMVHMQEEYRFKATEQMYKKRFAKWGFVKHQKKAWSNPGPSRDHVPSSDDRPVSGARQADWLAAKPSLGPSESAALLFLSKVRDLGLAYFELPTPDEPLAPPSAAGLGPLDLHTAHVTIQLMAELLARGDGALAGRLARKAFTMMEDITCLAGPSLNWNLLEILHKVAATGQTQLFGLLLSYFTGRTSQTYPAAHPLVHMFRSLRACEALGDHLPTLLEQAWAVNAKMVMVDTVDRQHLALYQQLIWDNTTLRIPPVHSIETGRWTSLPVQSSDIKNQMLVGWTQLCIDGVQPSTPSLDALRRMDVFHPAAWAAVLRPMSFDPVRSIPWLLGSTDGNPNPRRLGILQARGMATSLKLFARSDLEAGSPGDAADKLRDVVKLREYAHGRTNPHVVNELFLLRDALKRDGQLAAAAAAEEDGVERIRKFVEDTPPALG